ncbi:MAG TPA: hypothetical protein VM366_14250 [Anaerolineae bacterium]|nr:hypothetical protein [Anaerolineae bacterium]
MEASHATHPRTRLGPGTPLASLFAKTEKAIEGILNQDVLGPLGSDV